MQSPRAPASTTPLCSPETHLEVRFPHPPTETELLTALEQELQTTDVELTGFDGVRGEAWVGTDPRSPIGILIVPVPSGDEWILSGSVGCPAPLLGASADAFDRLGQARPESVNRGEGSAKQAGERASLDAIAKATAPLGGVPSVPSPTAASPSTSAATTELNRAIERGRGLAGQVSGEVAGVSGGENDNDQANSGQEAREANNELPQVLDNAKAAMSSADVKGRAAIHSQGQGEAAGPAHTEGTVPDDKPTEGARFRFDLEHELKALLDALLDFVPIISNIKDALTSATGSNPLTGEKVSAVERGITAVPLLGGAFKALKRAFKGVGQLLSGGGTDIARHMDRITSVTPAKPHPPRATTDSLGDGTPRPHHEPAPAAKLDHGPDLDTSARLPVGRSGQQHKWPNPQEPKPRNSPETIGGREYSGHAIDRMQERGFTPTVVENAIEQGRRTPGNKPGTLVYTDEVNGIKVVVNEETGRVVTIMERK